MNSPDQPLCTNHLRAGQRTRLFPPLESRNKLCAAGAPCSSEPPWWPPRIPQDSWALAPRTAPGAGGHTPHGERIWVQLATQTHLDKYKPRFSRTGSTSCGFWRWRQLRPETTSWHFSEQASINLCALQNKVNDHTLTFCTCLSGLLGPT